MKKFLIVFTVVFSIISNIKAQTGEVIDDSIMVNNKVRHFTIYKPTIYDASTAAPVLLNIHGLGSSDTVQLEFADFRAIADTANFIILLPEATGTGVGKSFKTFSTNQPTVDLAFISNLLDTLIADPDYNIDTKRIYSTGMSNGGYMSYDLANFMGDRIAAIASVSGTMVSDRANTMIQTHPIPVMQISGTTDQIVSYEGGASTFTAETMHIDSLVNFWVNYNHCSTTPTKTILPDVVTTDNSTVEHYLYSGGENGATVEFYKVIGGGHEWPGSAYTSSGSGNRNMDFDASKEIWRFLSQKSFTTDIKETSNIKNDVNVYPNPSNGNITINCSFCEYNSLILRNMLGQIIYTTVLNGIKTNIELNDVYPGMYSYQIMTDGQIEVSGTLIIQ